MKISPVSNLVFKDRQIEEFGESLIIDPKAGQLDENKYWLFADKQAQLNKALLLIQAIPADFEVPFQYYVELDDPKSPVAFEIREVKDLIRNEETTRAIGYKDGSYKTFLSDGKEGFVRVVKNERGITTTYHPEENWAGISSVEFYETGELKSIMYKTDFYEDIEVKPSKFGKTKLARLFGNKPTHPIDIHFHKNGNVALETYVHRITDPRTQDWDSFLFRKHFSEDETLSNLDLHYHNHAFGCHWDNNTDLSKTMDKEPDFIKKPYNWRARVPQELQEIIDENKKIMEG